MSGYITKVASGSPVEPFLLLLKNARGAGAVSILKQTLEDPNVCVFGELLSVPNVQELAEGPHATFFNLLVLFAFGTYQEYKAEKANLPELSAIQLKKLRLLTIATLATRNKVIPYLVLLNELDIPDVRNLENLIIEGIYSNVIRGKLDQKQQQVELVYALCRDFRPAALTCVTSVLTEWYNHCSATLEGINAQIVKANKNHKAYQKDVAELEKAIATGRKKQIEAAVEEGGVKRRPKGQGHWPLFPM